ncbi:hypothetical protein LEMLEM_LOCUS13894, partial [Lemmus lemmus]
MSLGMVSGCSWGYCRANGVSGCSYSKTNTQPLLSSHELEASQSWRQ